MERQVAQKSGEIEKKRIVKSKDKNWKTGHDGRNRNRTEKK